MARTRILVAGMPRMLRDIVGSLLTAHDDFEVVAEFTDASELCSAVERTAADVVILGLEDSELPDVGCQLLWERPSTKVLGIAADGRKAFLYELRPHRIPLGEVSPDSLVDAVRKGSHGNVNARLGD
jgi:DNA-binding NarL/FixJ family response regulator